ncbi:MAG: hypothetical protein OEM97_04000 [Acidimicrobiia bacterium]|nr:hypothetical protein [Acidimicrobiia bacterium]
MSIAILVVLVAIGVAVVSYVTIAGVRVSDRDVAWIAHAVQPPPPQAVVYSRYLQRHRRHRLAGGLFGTIFAVTMGIRWYGEVHIGIGEGNPLADILFCAMAGVLVGALSAETFRLSEPASSTIAASLATRDDPSRRDLTKLARSITIMSLAIGGLVAATGNGTESLWVAAAGGLVAMVAEATRSAISSRRRPVLSDQARAVDLRIRTFANRSVAALQLAAALLAIGWTVAKIPAGEPAAIGLLRFLFVLGCLFATAILLNTAAPRPSRTWTTDTLA